MRQLVFIFIFLFTSFNSLIQTKAEDSDSQEKEGKRSFAEMIQHDPSLPTAPPLEIDESRRGRDEIELPSLTDVESSNDIDFPLMLENHRAGRRFTRQRFQYVFSEVAYSAIARNKPRIFAINFSLLTDLEMMDFIMHRAAQSENPEFLERALKSETNVNTRFLYTPQHPYAKYSTALLRAIMGRNAENIRTLLAMGADPNIPNLEGTTPLIMAAYVNFHEGVEALLEHPETDVNATDKDGYTALHLVKNPDSLQLLLHDNRRTKLEEKPSILSTPVYETILHAQAYDHPEKIKPLLENGAYPNAIDGDGNTVLHRLAKEFHDYSKKPYKEAMNALLTHEETDPNARDAQGKTALYIAVAEGNHKATRVLLENDKVDPTITDNEGRTILHAYIIRNLHVQGAVESLTKLLANKKVRELVNVPDLQGNTPLHEVAKETPTSNTPKIMEKLIAAGADVNAEAEFSDDRTITALEILYQKEANYKESAVLIRQSAIVLVGNGAKIPEYMRKGSVSFLFGTEISDLIGEKKLEAVLEESTGCYQ